MEIFAKTLFRMACTLRFAMSKAVDTFLWLLIPHGLLKLVEYRFIYTAFSFM